MKILTALACDDIRQEQNNKHILIGVYGPSIRLSTIPSTIGLAYFLQVLNENERIETVFNVEIIVRKPDGREKKVIGASATTEHGDATIITIATPVIPISFEEECDIRFRIKKEGKRWVTALTHHVMLDSNLTSPKPM